MSSSSHEIYEHIRELFAGRKSNEVFEIEIVSPELGPLLRDGSCIGVTKAALAKAFIIARKQFMEYLVQCNNAPTDVAEVARVDDANKDIATTTEIILLFDCEYGTACNWRKRLISASKQEYVATKNGLHTLKDLLEREKSLMTTFLCSPLHRHTKSPTLWQHRLWILTELLKLKTHDESLQQGGSERYNDFLRELVLAELDVVCKAGQLHPRNYYAFSYMRQVHALTGQFLLLPINGELSETRASNNNSSLPLELALPTVEPMLKWCLSNPSDISGWMYLLYLLNYDDVLERDEKFEKKRKSVMDRTMHFAVQIAAWEGESLWTFVNLMLTRFGASVLPERTMSDTHQIGSVLEMKNDGGQPPTARWQATMNMIINEYGRNKIGSR